MNGIERLDAFSIEQSGEAGAGVTVWRGAQSVRAAYWKADSGEVAERIADFTDLSLRTEALACYMAQMSQGPVEQRIVTETMFEGVRKVPAGHRAVIPAHGGNVQIKALPHAPTVDPGLGPDVLVRRLKEVLLDTASDVLRERSDVWLEASGGMDSTLMGGLARRVMPAGARINAVSLLYPYYEFRRERGFIDRAVEWLEAKHTCLEGKNCLTFSDLDLTFPASEPSLVLAGLGQHRFVFSAVEEDQALLLNGNGGDNLFGLGPNRQPRFRSEPKRFEWMTEEFHAGVVARLTPLRQHYADCPDNDKEAFLSGGDIDDRWTERELAPRYGIVRTHLFLDPNILPLIRALWESEHSPPPGKWILERYFTDLMPIEIASRPGKVAYNGLYCRAYLAARLRLLELISAFSDYLEAIGIRTKPLTAHVERLATGRYDVDLEVSIVLTYLLWLRGWARAGRSLV